MIKRITILLLFFVLGYCSFSQDQNTYKSDNYLPGDSDNAFLDTLQYYSAKFFFEEINYDKGLVKDRTADYSPASIAAMGFALPVWAVASEKGWVSKDWAKQLTLNLLRFLKNSEQSTDTAATGYKGFYYHFLDIRTGKRVWKCELSSVDTGWLMMGVIFARNYYSADNPKEKEIREIADFLLDRIDWDFFVIHANTEYKNSVALAWDPETAALGAHGWVGYNESLFLNILAAGTGMSEYNKAFSVWKEFYRWADYFNGLEHLSFPPLFGHQYSHIFIDFHGIYDDYLFEKKIDFFENSRRAVLSQIEYAKINPGNYYGYDSLTWGFTACDGPGWDFKINGKKLDSYAARGATAPGYISIDDGTIAPTAAGGSIPFAPFQTIKTLRNLFDKYGKSGLWGKYGFKDAINPSINWIAEDYIGIDQGPIVLMIENYRSGFVWKYVMRDNVINEGLQRLGFIYDKDNR
ncbi:MAG: hypothetical protein K9I69_08905 [Ignavibacteriales bacterium]|nr:hypothetical protein [Ignavibacteriales bacterium]MCF8435573.1 hypothetical protein [Ignavibacteriales bacterium]